MIEMLLVIALAALMAGWGLPQGWIYLQEMRLEQSAIQLHAFLTRRQADAGWRNRSLYLWVSDAAPWCIGVDSQPGGDCRSPAAGHFTLPYADIIPTETGQREIGFYGLRNMAQGGHLTLANEAGRIRVVVSSRGRVRLCAESRRVMGILPCQP